MCLLGKQKLILSWKIDVISPTECVGVDVGEWGGEGGRGGAYKRIKRRREK